jgi:hypothetical protein
MLITFLVSVIVAALVALSLFVLFLGIWHSRARVCERCGTRERIPIDAHGVPVRIIWQPWSCRKCGCVLDSKGKPISEAPPPAPWTVLPASDIPTRPTGEAVNERKADNRIQIPANRYHEGRHN